MTQTTATSAGQPGGSTSRLRRFWPFGGDGAARGWSGRVGAILACVNNPFAGRYEPDLQPAMESLKPLGTEMSERLISARKTTASSAA